MTLKSKLIGAVAGLSALAAMTTTPATAYDRSAINACAAYNEYQPVNVINSVDDGTGYSLVWLEDADGELWMCNASKDGDIYAYEYVAYDLLEGTGPDLLQILDVSTERLTNQQVAEEACLAAAWVEPAQVVASTPDGLPTKDFVPGFTVFYQDGAGDYYLCNASGDAEIWALAPISSPINADYVS